MLKKVFAYVVFSAALLASGFIAHAQLSPALAPEGFDNPGAGGVESGIVSEGCENVTLARDSIYLQVSMLYDAKNKTCQLISGLPPQGAGDNIIAGFFPGSRPEIFEMFWIFESSDVGSLEKVSPEFPAKIIRGIPDGQPVTVVASCDECSGKPKVRFTVVLQGTGITVTKFETLGIASRLRSILPGGGGSSSDDADEENDDSNRFPEITEKDCADAQKQWNDLKVKVDALNCEVLQTKLDKLNAKKGLLESMLSDIEAKRASADQDLEKWRNRYQSLLKNGLQGDTYQFTKPSDAKNWNHVAYNRHGVQVWFKGQGKEMHQFYKDNAKDIKEIKQNIEKALKNKNRSQQDVDRVNQSMAALDAEISQVSSSLDTCKKNKKELEDELSKLEEQHAQCLAVIAAQKKIAAEGNTLREMDVLIQDQLREEQKRTNAFRDFDDEIEKLQNEVNTIPEQCNELFEKQVQVSQTLSAARRAREQSATEYQNAERASKAGELDIAHESLELAKKALQRAEERVKEAQLQITETSNAKRACINALKRQKKNEAAQPSDSRDDAEQDDSDKSDADTDVDVSAAVTAGQSNVQGNSYAFTSQTKAMGNVFLALKDAAVDIRTDGENPCDCPWKTLFAAGQYIGNSVGTKLIKDLGIGIMRAPIDAVNPGTTAGRIAQWVSSNALTAVGSDSLSDASLAVLQRSLVSKILPKTGAGIVDKPSMRLANTQVSELLESAGVRVWNVQGRQQVNNSCGSFGCNVSAVIMYNPHTRSFVVLMRSSCCNETILVDYSVDEKGIQATTPNVTVLY